MSKNNQKGLIKTIIVILIAIIVLSYLGFDIKKIFESEYLQKNLNYVWDILRTVWENYLAKPAMFVWNRAIMPLIDIIWKSFLAGLDKLKSVDTSSLDSTN